MKLRTVIGLLLPLGVFSTVLYFEFLGVRSDADVVAHVPQVFSHNVDRPAVANEAKPISVQQNSESASILDILGVKPSIKLPSSVVNAIHSVRGVNVPAHLDHLSAPEGAAIHRNFSAVRCEGVPIGSELESTVIQCIRKCQKVPECSYVSVDAEGTCSLLQDCYLMVTADVHATTYAVGPHVYSSDVTPSNEISHLWRMNKTNTGYHLGDPPHGMDLPPCIDKIFNEEYQKRPRAKTAIPELGVDQVYMVHYTKLVTRKKVITGLHALQGVHSDWVEAYDHQNITKDMRECIHERWDKSTYKNPEKRARPVPSPFVSAGGFKGGEMSVNTKHHYIYYDIVRNNYTFSIVLEDDAKLRAGFRRWFAKALKEMPNDFDLFVFGGCLKMYGWRMSKQKSTPISKHIYKKSMARCAHAYAVTLSGAKKFLSAMPLTDVIDFQMNRAILESSMKVYWVEPWLAVQGPVGEAGQPRKTATTGGDGEPYNTDNLFKEAWVGTWEQGVPPQPRDTFKIPKTSSAPVCDKKAKQCWWL